MTILAPAAAALALTLPAIIALYFLRIRRPPRVIPALHLWPEQIRDRQANVPWQRLRPSWLLFLQLLAAAVLVAAAVQPALPVGAGLARHTILLVDASAGMQARDVAPSRFDEAKRQAGELVSQIGPTDRMTLIQVGPKPQLLVSSVGNGDALRRALQSMRPSNGAGDLTTALNLAAGLVRAGDDAKAILFSDGILEPVRSSSELPFPVEYRRIGVSGENVAITALTVRTSALTRAAFVHVQNFGEQPKETSLEWRADDRLVDVRALKLAGGQAMDLMLPVPAEATSVSARLTGTDFFALDKTALAVARTPMPFQVLLVTSGNVFLEQALRLRPDFHVDVVTPEAFTPRPGYALAVLDGFAPRTLPAGPFMMVNPPAGSPLAGAAAVGIGRVRSGDAGDPLLAHVDLQDVHVARSQDLRTSTFGRPLLDSPQTPLVLVRDEPFRQVLVGFDLHESDLPLRVAFPILMENLTEWMLPPRVATRSFHPAEPVTIVPEAGAQSITVQRPDGSERSLPAGGIGTFPDTDMLGLYTVTQIVDGKSRRSWFTVNLFSDAISRLKPVDRLTLPPSHAPATAAVAHRGHFELWPLIALAALGIVILEWLAFHRGL